MAAIRSFGHGIDSIIIVQVYIYIYLGMQLSMEYSVLNVTPDSRSIEFLLNKTGCCFLS